MEDWHTSPSNALQHCSTTNSSWKQSQSSAGLYDKRLSIIHYFNGRPLIGDGGGPTVRTNERPPGLSGHGTPRIPHKVCGLSNAADKIFSSNPHSMVVLRNARKFFSRKRTQFLNAIPILWRIFVTLAYVQVFSLLHIVPVVSRSECASFIVFSSGFWVVHRRPSPSGVRRVRALLLAEAIDFRSFPVLLVSTAQMCICIDMSYQQH